MGGMGEKPGQIPQVDGGRVALRTMLVTHPPRDLSAKVRHIAHAVPNPHTGVRGGAGSSFPGAVWKDWQPPKRQTPARESQAWPSIAPKGTVMGTGCEAVRTLSSLV